MLFLSVGCTVDVHDVSRGVMFIILEELRDRGQVDTCLFPCRFLNGATILCTAL